MTDDASQRPVVLVVDDDRDVLATMELMLANRGFRVLTAVDRTSAMAVCAQYAGGIDAVVADLSMPGNEPQRDISQMLAQSYPHIKVVYATAVPRHIALSHGMVRPDAPYLEKPVSADVLTSALRTVIPDKVAWHTVEP